MLDSCLRRNDILIKLIAPLKHYVRLEQVIFGELCLIAAINCAIIVIPAQAGIQ